MKISYIGLGIIGLIVLLFFLGFFVFILAFSEKVYDKTSDWNEYYKETVQHYFKLPENAEIETAIHTDTAIMGMNFIVTFRLPDNKSPSEWLKAIALDSGMKDSYKKNQYLYDCGEDCDLWRLQYLPAKKLYQAEGGWD